ncbi:putative PurR-regulated permease PerM [Halanaerobium saccharolyticum]|uniref:Putative PurR-regulated permease PerM n=1 Tax=Halanaerobium saccharolyticum TaxID=43595 RepID=A0A4R7YYF8_9FIRM|nr:AI-2E family transporter [Halanaerobium saccharolyticum]RAK06661.1 putative PurR-regulated permease PerM [Halanaerobium saccharolyticum]TDW01200.1 putative PurR-regulated permease PerM [Halanaerobium saccharolyticum]TDX51444.1 putative PurR-regulated permease PerM [Halanaerobium saccharolyticum]
MFNERYFKIGHGLIIFLIIIFLAGQIPYFTAPLTSVLSFVLLPLLFSTFLYYLMRPLVRFLHKWIKNKALSIVISFLVVIAILTIVFYFGGSIIYDQGKELSQSVSGNYDYIYNLILGIVESLREYINFDQAFLEELNLRERIFSYANDLAQRISSYNYMGIFSSITNFGLIIVLIPFVLFYFLKDDQKIFENLMTVVPESKKRKTEKLAVEIDQLLSTFISSQLVVAFFLGLVMLIGFLIIGLPNAVVLSFIAMITSLIPIIGPFFGSLPAVFVAVTNSWFLFLGVLVIILIAQYLEGNVIRPLVQGRRLEIHPIVVLFVVLSGVYLFGFIGALTAVPLYVVLRLLFRKKYIEQEI